MCLCHQSPRPMYCGQAFREQLLAFGAFLHGITGRVARGTQWAIFGDARRQLYPSLEHAGWAYSCSTLREHFMYLVSHV